MNAKNESPHIIAARMQRWLEIIRTPIIAPRVPPWKARRNYLNLVRRHPATAVLAGFREYMAYPGPLLVEPQEVPQTGIQELSCPPPTLTETSIRPVSLEDEVLYNLISASGERLSNR